MPARYQDWAGGSHVFGTPDCTCLQGIRTGLQDLTVKKIRSIMPTRYQDGTAGPHRFGTTDPSCLCGIRMGLQDLRGWEH